MRGHIESFCSAGDTREYAPIGAEPEFGKRAVLTYIRAVKALRSIGKPTIALHDGAIEMPSKPPVSLTGGIRCRRFMARSLGRCSIGT